nr:Gfo/Idh/MocA family oxidoreductase [bacterium]
NIPRVAGSYRELIESDGIDAVYIPLPNSLHYEWTLRALTAGKHVLCEKPLVLDPARLRELETAARAAGRVLMEGMAYRMHPQFLSLRELVEDGAVGRLRLIRAHYSFTLSEDSGNIRLCPELGGGCLWDVGVYPVSLALGLDASRVVEFAGAMKHNAAGVDCLFAGQFLMASGTLVQFDCGFCLPYRVGAEVVGEGGRLILPNPFQPNLDGKTSGIIRVFPDDREEIIETEEVDPYLCEVEAMEESILDDAPPRYPLSESRRVIGAVVSLYRAAAATPPPRAGSISAS